MCNDIITRNYVVVYSLRKGMCRQMHCYCINRQLEEREIPDNIGEFHSPCVLIAAKKEAVEYLKGQNMPAADHLLEQSVRFCKAEQREQYITGSFYIPSHTMNKSHSGFRYILSEERLIFIDDTGFALDRVRKMAETQSWKNPGVGVVFAGFLEMIISGDVAFITDMENQLIKLEEEVLESTARDEFNHIISRYRRKIMQFSNYYLQLSDVSSSFAGNDSEFFSEGEQRLFQLFTERVNRLREETQMLREYSIQVREVYQSNIDMRQNQIMKVLTVVTTIFLPLTLIAGWYGMNFINMPELGWRYGYPTVIIISILILIICIWLFRKKKFW